LVREKSGENDSVSDMVTANPSVVGIENLESITEITALACHPSSEHIICGKDNGTVALYDTVTGREAQILYRHAHGISIHFLACGNSNLVVSADASSRCMAWRIAKDGEAWSAKEPLLDVRFPDYPIRQILLETEGKLLLVYTTGTDLVYDIESGHQISSHVSGVEARRWLNHPQDPDKLILVTTKWATTHRWVDLGESFTAINLNWGVAAEISIKDAALCSNGDMLYIESARPKTTQSTSKVIVLSTSSFTERSSRGVQSRLLVDKLASQIEHIIGWLGTRLLFLNRGFWVCSVDLLKSSDEYCRHFFIPEDWLSLNRSLILKVTSKGDLVFVKKDEIAVIKRWLDFKEAIAL
jgi:WD40 repeat protein